MLNSFKDKLTYLGLSFKREILVLVALNLALGTVMFVLIFFKVSLIIIIVVGCMFPVFNYLYLSRYGDEIRKINELHNNEFISLLPYFEMFIANHNNVYKSFQMLLPYSSEWMYERIDTLLKEIDQDKSVAPFIKFGNQFTNLVFQNVMISIFQMIEQGESNIALLQFDYLFTSLSEVLYHERISNKKKSLDKLNVFPLIGAGLITVILTFAIMSILGDLVNVI